MNIIAVDSLKIADIWTRIIPNIKKVMATQSKHGAVTDNVFDVEDTKRYIERGDGLLLVIHEGEEIIASCIVEVLNTEVGRSLAINTMGGTRIYEWNMLLLGVLKSLADYYQCNDIRIYLVRMGWVRCMKPYGFELIGDRKYAGETYPCLSYKVEKRDLRGMT